MEGKEKNRLIPLSDYVLELEKEISKTEHYIDLGLLTVKYTKFLKQNLSEPYEVNGVTAHPLNRFVPTDLEGNVLEFKAKDYFSNNKDWGQYKQSKDRCLFEGCFIVPDLIELMDAKIIEDLIELDITLTPTGAEMCGKEFEK